MALLRGLVLLGAVLHAAAMRALDKMTEDADPPVVEVEAGLKAAEVHVGRMERETAESLRTATAAVDTSQKVMQDALISGDIAASREAYGAFERAVAAKKAAEEAAGKARQLREMVKTHNALVAHFFDSVASFRDTQAAMDESRIMADMRDMAKVKLQILDRYGKQTKQEVMTAHSLITLFEDIKASAEGIKVKDDDLGGPGVHDAVKGGLVATRNWANVEMAKVCTKYLRTGDPKIKELRDGVRGTDGKVDCGKLLSALAEHFLAEPDGTAPKPP